MVVPQRLRTKSAHFRRDQQLAVLLLLPAATAIFVVMILPLGFALYASFFDYSLGQERNMTFVFLENYLRFFSDPSALRALLNTVLLTALSLVLCLGVGVGIAVLLRAIDQKEANFLRAIFSLPIRVSLLIVSL